MALTLPFNDPLAFPGDARLFAGRLETYRTFRNAALSHLRQLRRTPCRVGANVKDWQRYLANFRAVRRAA